MTPKNQTAGKASYLSQEVIESAKISYDSQSKTGVSGVISD